MLPHPLRAWPAHCCPLWPCRTNHTNPFSIIFHRKGAAMSKGSEVFHSGAFPCNFQGRRVNEIKHTSASLALHREILPFVSLLMNRFSASSHIVAADTRMGCDNGALCHHHPRLPPSPRRLHKPGSHSAALCAAPSTHELFQRNFSVHIAVTAQSLKLSVGGREQKTTLKDNKLLSGWLFNR